MGSNSTLTGAHHLLKGKDMQINVLQYNLGNNWKCVSSKGTAQIKKGWTEGQEVVKQIGK